MPSDRPSKSSPTPPARTSTTPDPMIGRVIHEKYKITALLARGGMGKVYKALQAPLDRVCAVKVLTPPQNEAADGQFHKRFFLEASIGARLTHPNTVTIFDYGVADDGVYFIAMEFLDGKTLHRVLREDGALPEERATHIARQISRSLREAHTLGVVHRDLKPANVYLLQHGDESDVVKVLDFGLVKNVEADDELTQTGLFMGSPKYMSPEQVKGEHVDARADVYALGVMLYEMLTGHVPFEKAKQLDTLLAHVHDVVPPLREKKPDLQVSETIEALVMRCLQKNPADRPAGMEEVLAVLKVASGSNSLSSTSAIDALRSSASFTPQPQVSVSSLSGEIPAANPTSIVPVDHPKPSRTKYIVAAGAALMMVGFAAIVTRSPKVDPPPAEAQPAAQKKAEPVVPSAKPSEVAPPPVAKIEEHFVEVESEPPGARVRDEAKVILCDKTPCKIKVESASLTVLVEQDGYGDQKVKLAQNEEKHLVKMTKSAAWHPPPAAKPTATAPANTAFKPDPYGSGPY